MAFLRHYSGPHLDVFFLFSFCIFYLLCLFNAFFLCNILLQCHFSFCPVFVWFAVQFLSDFFPSFFQVLLCHICGLTYASLSDILVSLSYLMLAVFSANLFWLFLSQHHKVTSYINVWQKWRRHFKRSFAKGWRDHLPVQLRKFLCWCQKKQVV